MVDRQVQGDDRIVTSGVDEGVRVVARLRDARVLVPVKGVTSHSRGVTQRGMSDGQVQGDHRVTTGSIDEGVGVVARLRDVGVLVPCEGILRRSCSVTRVAVVDC